MTDPARRIGTSAAGAAGRGHVLRWASLVLALAAARGAALVLVVPPLEAPDEDVHFDYVQYLAEEGRLPPLSATCAMGVSPELAALGDVSMGVAFRSDRKMPPPEAFRPPPDGPAARRSPACTPATPYPPLYYATAAAAYRSAYPAPLLVRLRRSREASVLWTCGGALAAFLLGWWLSGRPSDGALLGVLYASQPMIGMLGATVNNDAALFALSTASLAACAAAWRAPSPHRPLIALALLGAAGVSTKPTFLLLLPLLLIAAAVAAARPRRGSPELGAPGPGHAAAPAWAPAAAALAPSLLAGVAWATLRPPPSVVPATAGALWKVLPEVLDPARLEPLYVELYWMSWGWVDTRLPVGWYRAIEIAVGAAAVGLLVGWRRLAASERAVVVAGVGGTAAMALVLHAMELGWRARTGNMFVQGRYLLPLFVPFAGAVVCGLRALARRARVPLDPGWLLALLLLALQGAAVVRALERWYTPRLPEAVTRATAWATAAGCGALRPTLAVYAAALAGTAAVALLLALRPVATWRSPDEP